MLIEMFEPFKANIVVSLAVLYRFDNPVSGIELSEYQAARWNRPLTQRKSGNTWPSAATLQIPVAHSRLPGWTAFGLPIRSEHVTTIFE